MVKPSNLYQLTLPTSLLFRLKIGPKLSISAHCDVGRFNMKLVTFENINKNEIFMNLNRCEDDKTKIKRFSCISGTHKQKS